MNMKTQTLKILIAITIAILSTSCTNSDDSDNINPELESTSRQITTEIQNTMTNQSIERIYCNTSGTSWGNIQIFGDYGLDFEFRGEILYWKGRYFSLTM